MTTSGVLGRCYHRNCPYCGTIEFAEKPTCEPMLVNSGEKIVFEDRPQTRTNVNLFLEVAKMTASLQSERAKLNRHAAFKALGTIE
jgi:hypothetical protein